MLYKIGKPIGEPNVYVPVPGFAVEVVRFRGLEFTVVDIFSDRYNIDICRPYFEETRGIIFVLDSSSRNSFRHAGNVLNELLIEDDLYGLPLLILANKTDLIDAATELEVADGLDLNDLDDTECGLYACTAVDTQNDESFYEGLNWLAEQLADDDRRATERDRYSY